MVIYRRRDHEQCMGEVVAAAEQNEKNGAHAVRDGISVRQQGLINVFCLGRLYPC
jgi:hypothetical protein